MTDTFNVYCDGSCHLKNGRPTAMVLGVVYRTHSPRGTQWQEHPT